MSNEMNVVMSVHETLSRTDNKRIKFEYMRITNKRTPFFEKHLLVLLQKNVHEEK